MLKVAPWTNAPKVSSPNFFRLYGLLLFCITMGLGCARCKLRYKDDGKRQFSRKRSSVADTLVSLAQLKYIFWIQTIFLHCGEKGSLLHIFLVLFSDLRVLVTTISTLFLSFPRMPDFSTTYLLQWAQRHLILFSVGQLDSVWLAHASAVLDWSMTEFHLDDSSQKV